MAQINIEIPQGTFSNNNAKIDPFCQYVKQQVEQNHNLTCDVKLLKRSGIYAGTWEQADRVPEETLEEIRHWVTMGAWDEFCRLDNAQLRDLGFGINA